MLFATAAERNIPSMPRRVSSPVFVGRITERAVLSAALERAEIGQPGVVVISGEAGIGKSRLLGELVASAAAREVRVVRGVCVDVASGTLAYTPFVDIVRELHRAGFTSSLPVSTRHEISRLVPEAGPEPAEPGGDRGQGRLFAAIRDLLAAASSSTPLLVTIEDIHWADTSTLDLITYLARSVRTERSLLVATARIDTLPRRHALRGVVAELVRLPWVDRIDLPRFDEPQVLEQLTGILGDAPSPQLARAVFERSDGNAFFAEELVAAGAGTSGPLPASLREVLAGRLAALDEETQRVVRVAAVAGRIVSHELLERIAGTPPAAVVAAVREAIEQRVLVDIEHPAPGYAFRHALVREAAADELLPAERTAIHGAIADALEGGVDASTLDELTRTGEIAFHALAANDLSRALSASLAAVAAAERASAFAEVEVHLNRVIDLWPRIPDAAARIGTDKPGLLVRTMRAAGAAGHQPRAVALAHEALAGFEASDTDRRVTTLLELFDYAWEASDIKAAERAIAEAMPIVRGERSARSARAYAEAGLLDWHHGRYSTARDAAIEAIEIAGACGARAELGLALTVLGQIHTHTGATGLAETAFAEAAAILEETGDPDVRARSSWWRSWAREMHGRFEESLTLIRDGIDRARRDGADGRYGVHLSEIVLENLIELGRWTEARAVGDEILRMLSISFEMIYTHGSLARLATLLGRPADAERELAEGARIHSFGQHRVWQLEDGIFLAYSTGRYADGRRDMELAIAALPEPDKDATLWWPLLKSLAGEADRADAARRRRRTAEADDAVATGRRFAQMVRGSARAAIEADGGGPMTTAVLRGVDAEEARLDGRHDPAAWAAVVEARRELGQPWEVAYARFRHGEAILGSGGPATEAAIPLAEAHAAASQLGAAPLRSWIEAVASRARIQLGEGPQRAGRAEKGAAPTLSDRELEVLALVAAGHTNREIGDRLFISEKTVSVHVTHTMNKLGALSRYEAAATATRQGLLDRDER